MYKWGPVSQRHRLTLHPKLLTAVDAILLYRDAAITDGHRNELTQNHLHDTGKSKKRWPNSKHNTFPSRAVDIVPYPFNPEWWDLKKNFHVWVEWQSWVRGLAAGKGIKIRGGFDWDGDFDMKDQTFYDGPHFELDDEEE
jgi:hypothetical protein